MPTGEDSKFLECEPYQQGDSEWRATRPVRQILAVAAEMLAGETRDFHHAELMVRAINSCHYADELDGHRPGPLYRLLESKFDEIDKAMLEHTFHAGFGSRVRPIAIAFSQPEIGL